MEPVEAGEIPMVKHEHSKRTGRCQSDKLDDISYDSPTLVSNCLASYSANINLIDSDCRLVPVPRRDLSRFDPDCPFIRCIGLHHGFPNMYTKLLGAIAPPDNPSLKVLTMESDVYVRSSFMDPIQFMNNIGKLHRPLTAHIFGVSKVSINHPKKSLRDPSIGDSLELMVMRLRQKTCSICCHDDLYGDPSDRRIMCLPCSHLYHEDCIMSWLMKNSSCPLCGYQISVDEVEYKLPRDWRQRHRKYELNLHLIFERIAREIEGTVLGDIDWLVKHLLFLRLVLFVCEDMWKYDLKKSNAKSAVIIREEPEKLKKENWIESAVGNVLRHRRFNSEKDDDNV